MDVLETLFSSQPRVKVLRAFLFQPGQTLSAPELAEQTGVATNTARAHARDLASIDFLEEQPSKDSSNGQPKSAWRLNKDSGMREPLHELMLTYQDTDLEDIRSQLMEVGDVLFAAVTGVLIGADGQPLDLLIVGENIDSRQLERTLTRIETALGTEIRFAQFDQEEFEYRLNIYDRLIQNVLENSHEVIVDELGVS